MENVKKRRLFLLFAYHEEDRLNKFNDSQQKKHPKSYSKLQPV